MPHLAAWKLHYEGFGRGVWRPKIPAPIQPVVPVPTKVIGMDVEWEAACDWFWRNEADRDPNAGMPDSIKPPPPPIQKPNGMPNLTQPVVAPQPSLPSDLAHCDDILQAELKWAFAPSSNRCPMPDSVKPPPAPTVSSKTSSVQSSVSSQSWQSVQHPLPADLAHLDDLYQNECAWVSGPGAASGKGMPDSIKPPPIPNSVASTNGSLSSTPRRPPTINPTISWLQAPVTGGRPVSNKRKETT